VADELVDELVSTEEAGRVSFLERPQTLVRVCGPGAQRGEYRTIEI
jgi:hypothetical protein